MNGINWTLAVMVEGLCFDLDDTIRPSALTVIPERTEPAPEGRITGAWYPALVHDGSTVRLTLGAQSWSPIKGQPGVQTLDFTITTQVDGELMTVRNYFMAKPEPIAVLAFGEVITPTTTSFDVVMLDGGDAEDYIDVDSIIYIGREAFRVASVSVNTISIKDELAQSFIYPDGGSNHNVQRSTHGAELAIGHFGTRIVTHTARTSADQPPEYDDDRIYTSNPVLRGRRIWLFRCAVMDGELIEQCIGQFIISGDGTPITKSDDGTTLTISCVALAGSMNSYQFNAAPVQYSYSFFQVEDSQRVVAVGAMTPTSRVADSVWLNQGLAIRVMQDGDRVATVAADIALLPSLTFGGQRPDVARVITRDEYIEATDGRRSKRFNEVLTTYPFDRVTDDAGQAITITGSSHPYYSTERPDPADPTSTSPGILRHPLHQWLAHMGGLASNLPAHYVAPFGRDALDVAGVLALARGALGHLTEWPGVMVGGDGKAFNGLEWADEAFLIPNGCARAVDQFGRITVRSIITPLDSTITLTDAMVGARRPMTLPLGVAADAIETVTGTGLGKSPIAVFRSMDAYAPTAVDQRITEVSINADGALAAVESGDPRELLDRPTVQHIRNITTSLGALMAKTFNQLSLDVSLASLNELNPLLVQPLVPGALLRLTLRAMDDPITGELSDSLSLSAIVMEHQWSQDFTTQSIRLGVFPYLQRSIGYALLIDGVTDNGGGNYALTFDADQSILPDSSGSPYVAPDGTTYSSDLATLAHAVTVYGATKALLANQYLAARDLVDIDATGNIVAGTTPVVGDWIVLADLGDGNATAEDFFSYFGRDKYGV